MGLERKCVFLFGFDDGCYEVFKDEDHNAFPNPLYVGATRATQLLVVFQHAKAKRFSYLSEDFRQYCDYIDMAPVSRPKKLEETSLEKFYHSMVSVTALLKHVSFKNILLCQSKIERIQLSEPHEIILINNCPKQKNGLSEEVSEINGTGIIAHFEWLSSKKLTIFEKLDKNDFENNSVDVQKLFETFGKPEFPVVNNHIIIGKMLKLAVWYCARSVGLTYKLDQITSYDWLPKKTLDLCAERLKKHISKNASFEVNTKCDITIAGEVTSLFGAIDCVDGFNIWEFKCVHTIAIEHFLQLAMYAHLYTLQNPTIAEKLKYFLYNVLSDEMWEIKIDTAKTEEMIKVLIQGKLGLVKIPTNEEFSQKVQNIKMTQDAPPPNLKRDFDIMNDSVEIIPFDDDVTLIKTPDRKPLKARAKIIKM
jgi:hypothetical protein